VLLSILYNTLESSAPTENIRFVDRKRSSLSLRWVGILHDITPHIHAYLSKLFIQRTPLASCFPWSLASLSQPSPSLVQYPLARFIVTVQAIIDMSLEPQPHARQLAVFLRILFQQ
jgi:hypothetical protein